MPPIPDASYPSSDSVGTTTSPGTDPPPSAPILGNPNASISTEPTAVPVSPSPAGPTATTADAVEVSKKEGGGALSGGSEELSTADQQNDVRGPDNRQYAVSGRVRINTSEISGDPQATIRKAQTIRRAANAPTEPSSQDRSIASAAAQMEAKARR